ncbi:MAG: hypothetical protein M3186_06855 [Actinomycetota bacterium]|nr:hypothetical protein [Actinomycetota bacterium]
MADPARYPGIGEGADVRPGRASPPRMPLWVKVPAIIIGILVLLFVVLKLTGLGGKHGPGRHLPGGAPPTASVTEVHMPPEGDPG